MRIQAQLATLFLLIFVSLPLAHASAQEREERVVMDVFWGVTCGHCRAQKPFLKQLEERYPELQVRQFEVYESIVNRDIFTRTARAHQVLPNGVPAVFVAGKVYFGNSAENQKEIEATVVNAIGELSKKKQALSEETLEEALIQETEGALSDEQPLYRDEAPEDIEAPKRADAPSPTVDGLEALERAEVPLPAVDTVLKIPFMGEVDVQNYSLLVSTLLIAFVDGVNPCSLWVLMLLLGLVVNSHSRKRALLVGTLFLFTTAAIYGAFVAGVFKVLSILSFLPWIQWIVGLFALIFGLVNVKDFFWFKKGFSFTIADSSKPGIYRSIRGLLDPDARGWALASATVVMAAGIALIELPCTAGFPVIWSGLVQAQNVPWPQFFLLLAAYLLVYLLDELVIFTLAITTMKIGRFEETQGRNLKLIGGLIMVALAGILLIRPEMMNSLSGMFWLFAICGILSALIIALDRRRASQS